jgi:MFS transporter, SP family, sugar:H+ symporter
MTFSQLYLQECAPAKYRGLALSCFMFWTSLGTLVGTIVDNFTAPILDKRSYLIPLGLIYIVPAFVTFGLLFVRNEADS